MKLLLLATVTAVCLRAQATATLHGRVTDPTGASVAGAMVALENTAAGFHAE
ncbi:MAG: hypothetical protein RL328_2701, partial [Acidobacteriota bacterium]